LDSRVL